MTYRHLTLLMLPVLSLGAGCSAGGGHRDAGRDAGEPDAEQDAGPPDTSVPDVGPMDADPCEGLTVCGESCVDTMTDPAHCGGCDMACTPPADARARCEGGSCGFTCLPGFVEEAGACVAGPRLLWPPSLSTVSTHRPTFRVDLPAGTTDATLQLCSDRACGTVLEEVAFASGSASPTGDLPTGIVYFRASASGRSSPTWEIEVRPASPEVDTAFGVYPDVDGDGSGDVVVGAPRVEGMVGRVYVYLGGPAGTPASASVSLNAPDGADAEHGWAIACAGDLDGDGFADLAVGSPGADGGAGRVHVYLGRSDGIAAAPDVTLVAPDAEGRRFGGALAGASDIDGDGFGDLVVAAVGEGVTPGRIYLFAGSASGPATAPTRTVIGAGHFGSAVAAGGDLDGDGYADVAVGAPHAGSMAGQVQVFLGSESGLGAAADVVIDGTASMGQLGASLAFGEVNGDGLSDLIAGAPAADAAVGHVLVFHGADGGPADTPDRTVMGTGSGGSFFGQSVTGLGDADGDGIGDVAVGAFGVADRAGRVSVFLGSAGGMSATPAVRLDGPFGTGGDFGWAVASAGDMDRSGSADLVVGAPATDSGGGRAYVYRGAARTGVTLMPLRTIVGPSGGAFGRALGGSAR